MKITVLLALIVLMSPSVACAQEGKGHMDQNAYACTSVHNAKLLKIDLSARDAAKVRNLVEQGQCQPMKTGQEVEIDPGMADDPEAGPILRFFVKGDNRYMYAPASMIRMDLKKPGPEQK